MLFYYFFNFRNNEKSWLQLLLQLWRLYKFHEFEGEWVDFVGVTKYNFDFFYCN